jgi:hypothetical protein
MFAYHRDPTNVRVEFVDAASRSVMEQFIFRPRDQ